MVQEFGLELLLREDTIKDGAREYDNLRLSMLASGTREFADLYPEYFPERALEIDDDTPDDVLANPDSSYDYSGVEWQGPGDMSADEVAMLEQFLDDPTGRITVSAGDDEDGWI